jgi:hypothetical protein
MCKLFEITKSLVLRNSEYLETFQLKNPHLIEITFRSCLIVEQVEVDDLEEERKKERSKCESRFDFRF